MSRAAHPPGKPGPRSRSCATPTGRWGLGRGYIFPDDSQRPVRGNRDPLETMTALPPPVAKRPRQTLSYTRSMLTYRISSHSDHRVPTLIEHIHHTRISPAPDSHRTSQTSPARFPEKFQNANANTRGTGARTTIAQVWISPPLAKPRAHSIIA